MDLDDVYTGLNRSASSLRECFDEPVDSRGVKLGRLVEPRSRNRAGCQEIPSVLRAIKGLGVAFECGRRACLAPGMRQLNAREGAFGVDDVDHPGEIFRLLVVPQAEVARRDASFGRHGRRFDEDRAESTDGASAIMLDVPVG